MRKGAAGRRLLAPGALHLDRRLRPTLAVYLVVITVIVGYNARAIADQRGSALSVNVAARQRAPAERHEQDVGLTNLGIQDAPGAGPTGGRTRTSSSRIQPPSGTVAGGWRCRAPTKRYGSSP